jgi:hypothetical protein
MLSFEFNHLSQYPRLRLISVKVQFFAWQQPELRFVCERREGSGCGAVSLGSWAGMTEVARSAAASASSSLFLVA